MAPQKIIALRHPQCAHNVQWNGDFGDTENPPITHLGQKQLEAGAKRLVAYLGDSFGDTIVHTSTYPRTHFLPLHLGLSFSPKSSLDERNSGIWKRRSRDYIRTYCPDVYQQRHRLMSWDYQPQDGESVCAVADRMAAYVQQELRQVDAEVLIISGHGISGIALHQVLTSEPVTETEVRLQNNRLKNMSWTEYERQGEGSYRCVCYNDISHLADL